MVPAFAITEWARTHPWATSNQVEQDLLLSKAICAIASEPYLGTAMHSSVARNPPILGFAKVSGSPVDVTLSLLQSSQ